MTDTHTWSCEINLSAMSSSPLERSGQLNAFAAAPLAVCEGSSGTALTEARDNGITAVVSDAFVTASWEAAYNRIRIPLCSLEWLWAYTFAFANLFLFALKRKDEGITTAFAEGNNPIRKSILDIHDWANTTIKCGQPVPWPEDVPSPDASTIPPPLQGLLTNEVYEETIETTGEHWKRVAGFILLHELAHLVGEQLRDNWEEELRADRWAVEQVLQGRSRNADGFPAACFAICCGFSYVATVQGLKQRYTKDSTHPSPMARIAAFSDAHLRETAPGSDDWCLSQVLLCPALAAEMTVLSLGGSIEPAHLGVPLPTYLSAAELALQKVSSR
jgi:hypothetical protein